MITVSTVSEREADCASAILGGHLPRDVDWEVYLRGTLHRNRQSGPWPENGAAEPPEPPVEQR